MIQVPLVQEHTIITDPLITFYSITPHHLVLVKDKALSVFSRDQSALLWTRNFDASVVTASLTLTDVFVITNGPDPQYCFADLASGKVALIESPELQAPWRDSDFVSFKTVYPKDRKWLACVLSDFELYLVQRGDLGIKRPQFTRLQSEGRVAAVQWIGDVLVWAIDTAVYLYNVKTQQKIGNVPICGVSGIWCLSECTLGIVSETRRVLTILKLRKIPFQSLRDLESDDFMVEQIMSVKAFQFPLEILSISAFQANEPDVGVLGRTNDGSLKVLLLSPDLSETVLTQDLQLDIRDSRGGEVDISVLTDTGSIVSLSPRSLVDHAQWYLSHGLPGEALRFAKASGDPHILRTVGFASFRPLLETGRISEASLLVPLLRIVDSQEWTDIATLFARYGASSQIASYLPYPPTGVQLETGVYTEILKSADPTHPDTLDLIRKWPRGIYDARSLLDAYAADCDRNFDAILLLLEHESLIEEALELCLEYKRKEDLFGLLNSARKESADLTNWLSINCVRIMTLDIVRGCVFFVDNMTWFEPQKLIDKLGKTPFLQVAYLAELCHKKPDACEPFSRLLVKGAFQFRPDILPDILQKYSSKFSEEELHGFLELCGPAGDSRLQEAKTLILWKLGRPMDALDELLATDESKALDFASRINDAGLWECLIHRVVDSGEQGKIEMLVNQLSGVTKAQVFAKLFSNTRTTSVILSNPLVEGLRVWEAETRVRALLGELTLADIEESRLRSDECSRGGEEIDLTNDFCWKCRRPIQPQDSGAEHSLEQLALRENFPNSTSMNPWIAVFRDKRVAHSVCLIDFRS